jgi:hypothetical protein
MPAPKGNRNAEKADDDRRDHAVFVRLKRDEKRLCELAAGDTGIGVWAREILMREAEQDSR